MSGDQPNAKPQTDPVQSGGDVEKLSAALFFKFEIRNPQFDIRVPWIFVVAASKISPTYSGMTNRAS